MGTLAGGRRARVQAQIHGVGAVPPPRRFYAALPVPLGEQRLLHALHVHLRLLLAALRLYEHRATVRGIVGLSVKDCRVICRVFESGEGKGMKKRGSKFLIFLSVLERFEWLRLSLRILRIKWRSKYIFRFFNSM